MKLSYRLLQYGTPKIIWLLYVVSIFNLIKGSYGDWHGVFIASFWVIVLLSTFYTDLKSMGVFRKDIRFFVHLGQKGIVLRQGAFKTERYFPWEDIAQVCFVRTRFRPGIFHIFGTLYFSRRELSLQQWNGLTLPDADILDVQVKTERDYSDVMKFIKPYVPESEIIEEDIPGNPDEYVEYNGEYITEPARIPATKRIDTGFYAAWVVSMVFLGLGEGIWMVCFMLGIVLALQINRYYKISERSIRRYVFPSIPRAEANWEDIVEAGFSPDGSAYIAIKPQYRVDIQSGALSFKSGIIAYGTNP